MPSFRAMTEADLPEVSKLGIESKATWGYPPGQMVVFREELTFDSNNLHSFTVAEVAMECDRLVGYYTLRRHADGSLELDHMFVAADRLRRGIGATMLQRAILKARELGATSLMLIADPSASGFYERFGAIKTGDHQSSIPDRTIPIYEIELGADD